MTLGAPDQDQALVGPAFAGSEVVWGERTLPGTSRAELSVLAAAPGAHGSTLFSTRPQLSMEDEIDPLGLVASPRRIAFAYQVQAPQCGPMSGACGLPDLPEARSAAAFSGPLGGPFRRLAGDSLKNGAIGLSGEEVVLAEPVNKGGADYDSAYVEDLASGAPARDVGAVGASGVYVAGSYMASSTLNSINVTTLAGKPVYSVLAPTAHLAECAPDANGVHRYPEGATASCGYALGADGTLAIASMEPGGLYWASPAQPQLHPIAVTLASPLVAIANDEIVYLSPVGAHDTQLSLTGLTGGTRPISAPIDGGGEAVSGLAFNGTSVAWADHCVYAGDVPAAASSTPPNPACQAVAVHPRVSRCATFHARGSKYGVYIADGHVKCSVAVRILTAVDSGKGKIVEHGSSAGSYVLYRGWLCPFGNMGEQTCEHSGRPVNNPSQDIASLSCAIERGCPVQAGFPNE